MDPSVCSRCATAMGGVCCQLPKDGQERLATLTLCDIARIREATGLPEHRFVEREEFDPAERLAFEEARPLYRGLFEGLVRHGLRARRGACVLLEEGVGCQLSEAARPLACLLYPFDLAADGRLTVVSAPHCLALAEASGERDLLRMFATTRELLLRLFERARSEAAAHAASRSRHQR